MPEAQEQITVMAEATNELKEADIQNKAEFEKWPLEKKVELLPEFSRTLNESIFRASTYINLLQSMLQNDEFREPKKSKAEQLINDLKNVRDALVIKLAKELEPDRNYSIAVQILKSKYVEAKIKHEQGLSLDYVKLLNDYANLKMAREVAQSGSINNPAREAVTQLNIYRLTLEAAYKVKKPSIANRFQNIMETGFVQKLETELQA